jgi:ParB family chromosome partitioning protein
MNSFQLKKVKGLGRGLSSLLGDTKSKTNITKLKIYDVKRNRLQPRKVFNKESLEELTNSIKERGVIQPIIVRKDKSLVGKFEIIAGERRWLASQNAGLHEIPVVILDVDDEKTLEFAIVENVQRRDLNAIEEAQGYQRLIDEFSYNQEKLAKFIGKSRSYIANSLRLLSLPKDVILYVESEKISAGHARSLIGLPNAMQIAQKIAENKLSVRQSENLVRALRNKKNLKIVPSKDSNILDLEKSLVDKTGINVEIKNNKNNSGRLSFEYKNLEQLDRLINTIKNNY